MPGVAQPLSAPAPVPAPERKPKPVAPSVEPTFSMPKEEKEEERKPFVVIVSDGSLKKKFDAKKVKTLDYFDLPITHYPDQYEMLIVRIDKGKHYDWLLAERKRIEEMNFAVLCVFRSQGVGNRSSPQLYSQ